MLFLVIILAFVAVLVWSAMGLTQRSGRGDIIRRQQTRQARLESMRLARETDEAFEKKQAAPEPKPAGIEPAGTDKETAKPERDGDD